MHYLIDGYNLLHQVGILLGRVPPGRLEAARTLLLRHLRRHQDNDPTVSITVVFDAARSPRQRDSRQTDHEIEVYFTHSSEADDLIEELVRQAELPQRLTVVSDDRRLQEAARRRRCPVMSCLDYWEAAASEPRQSPAPQPEEHKPTGLSAEEVERWQREFGEMEAPRDFEEWFRDEEERDQDGR